MMTQQISHYATILYTHPSQRIIWNIRQNLKDAFARHGSAYPRDMGPKSRYLGPEVPKEDLIWLDPVSPPDYELIDSEDISKLKMKSSAPGLPSPNCEHSLASAFHLPWFGYAQAVPMVAASDWLPQKDWEVNEPELLNKVLDTASSNTNRVLTPHKQETNKFSIGRYYRAGGAAAMRTRSKGPEAPTQRGSFRYRGVATLLSGADRHPVFRGFRAKADGFRNYHKMKYSVSQRNCLWQSTAANADRPEMTVLIGGMRIC
jgi:catalase-peroxidase